MVSSSGFPALAEDAREPIVSRAGHHWAARLNPLLLKHVCAEPVDLSDLELLDDELFRSLEQLLEMDAEVIDCSHKRSTGLSDPLHR